MSEPIASRDDDAKLRFEVLFDLRSLLVRLVALVDRGDDDGQEEAEEDDPDVP